MTGKDKRKIKKKRVKTQAILIRQRNIIIGLTVSVIIISITLGIILHLIRRNLDTFVDLDEREYYSRYTDKKKDEIAIYDSKNQKLQKTPDDKYFSTEIGTLIKLAANGKMSQYAIVDLYSEKEALGVNDRVLIFKHTEKKDIQSIEVHNDYGTYKFYKDNKGYFQIEGVNSEFIKAANQSGMYYYNPELFSSLVVSCGYTLSMNRLDKEKVEQLTYEEYGLAIPPTGVEITEENKAKYTNTYYIVTDLLGNSYKVFIGNEIVSGAGYYVRLEGRENCVYILSNTLEATVLQPIEALIEPRIVFPMTLNTYFDVQNFLLLKFNEQKYQDYINSKTPTGDEDEDEDDIEYYDVVVAFSYIDLELRQDTKRQSQPYIMLSSDMLEYIPNDMNIDSCLQSIYNMAFEGVKKIKPTKQDLIDFGLDEPEYIFSFDYAELNYEEKGEIKPSTQTIIVSKRTEDGTHYAYSEMFDMIVEIDRSYLDFLEYTDVDWLSDDLFDTGIVFCKEIEIKYNGTAIKFVLDNSASEIGKSDKLIVKAYVNDEYTIVDTSIFRKFYQTILYTTFRGEADLTDEQRQQYQQAGDEGAQLIMTIKTVADLKTDVVKTDVYRTYEYSPRRAYATINGKGSLYMLVTMGEKIAADAQRVIDGEPIDPTGKY